jgi:hypothetical protein
MALARVFTCKCGKNSYGTGRKCDACSKLKRAKPTVRFNINSGLQLPEQKRVFKIIHGKLHIWFVAVVPNEGDNIYCETENKSGFGGSVVKFLLENGSIATVRGPWHSNSESLLHDTGYDCTSKHYTRGIVALEMTYAKLGHQNDGDTYKNVLHYDAQPELGKFDRIYEIARAEAKIWNKRVYYAHVSVGGGMSGSVEPNE